MDVAAGAASAPLGANQGLLRALAGGSEPFVDSAQRRREANLLLRQAEEASAVLGDLRGLYNPDGARWTEQMWGNLTYGGEQGLFTKLIEAGAGKIGLVLLALPTLLMACGGCLDPISGKALADKVIDHVSVVAAPGFEPRICVERRNARVAPPTSEQVEEAKQGELVQMMRASAFGAQASLNEYHQAAPPDRRAYDAPRGGGGGRAGDRGPSGGGRGGHGRGYTPMGERKCYECGVFGHIAKDCAKAPKPAAGQAAGEQQPAASAGGGNGAAPGLGPRAGAGR